MSKGRRSFSLVEVILTLLIIGILSAITLPRFFNSNFLASLTLRSAASQITSDMRYTRQLAITNSSQYTIDFNFHQKEYAIYKGGDQVGETKKIPADIQCSGTSRFTFNDLGSCTFDHSGLILFLSGSQYRITVEPPSGAVIGEKL